MSVQVQGAQIHVKEQGQGIPTLFLHGFPDSADMWEPIIAKLPASLHTFAIDLPGFGRSTLPNHFDVSLDNLARFVDETMTALGITQPLNLVVHDFGGTFGLAWAAQYPEKVRRLVISNVAFSVDYQWHFFAKLYRTPLVGEMLMYGMNYAGFRMGLKGGGAKLSDAHIRHTYDGFSKSARQMGLKLYRATNPKDFPGWEEKLRQTIQQRPTLVIWGDRDPFVKPAYAESFGAQEIIHLPESGHWPPVEEPEAYTAALTRFLV